MNVSTRPPEPLPTGKLDWRQLLGWLRDDGMIERDEADKTMKRFGSTQSAQHPLVRLAAASLQRKGPPRRRWTSKRSPPGWRSAAVCPTCASTR
jgi:hypothetical protein